MEKHAVILEIDIPFRVVSLDYLDDKTIPSWDTKRMTAYAEALQREIKANAAEFSDCQVQAIRFGGGAASNACQHIADIMRVVRESFDIAEEVSITMESSISNISGATMPLFRRAGIQRFDFEMMSLDEVHYIKFNKVDNLKDLPVVCDNFLHSYKNDTLGFVLAYGLIPSEKETAEEMAKIFRRSIVAVTRSSASHLLLRRAKAADEALVKHQLVDAQEVLTTAGFAEYLPDCWAREGKKDPFFVLNKGFANDAGVGAQVDKLAFGLGAATRFEGVLTKNTFDLSTYLQYAEDYTRITKSTEILR